MTKLDEGLLRSLAELSQLSLTDDEAHRFRDQLDQILSFAEQIQALDTADVPKTSHALLEAGREDADAMRDDAVEPSLDRERVLGGAPDSGDGLFKVPRVLP